MTGHELYRYSSSGAYEHKSSLNSLNADPSGITSANGRLYIADNIRDRVYVYDGDGTRLPEREFNLHADNDAQGITFGHDRFFMADLSDHKIYVYDEGGNNLARRDVLL